MVGGEATEARQAIREHYGFDQPYSAVWQVYVPGIAGDLDYHDSHDLSRGSFWRSFPIQPVWRCQP